MSSKLLFCCGHGWGFGIFCLGGGYDFLNTKYVWGCDLSKQQAQFYLYITPLTASMTLAGLGRKASTNVGA